MFDENSGRGPFWDIAAVGALGYGIGLPLLRQKADLANIFSGGNLDNIGRSVGRLGHSSNFNTLVNARTVSEINVNPYLSSFAKDISSDTLKKDIFAFAYEASMTGRKFGASDIRAGLAPIFEQENPALAFKYATSKIADFGGDTTLLQRRLVERAEPGSFIYSSAAQSSHLKSVMATPLENISKSYSATTLFDLKKSDPFAHQQAMKFEELIGSISGEGVGQKPISYFNVKDIIKGEEVSTPVMRLQVGKESINVPLSNKSPFLYSGEDFTTRYIPRKSYTKEGRILSHAETVYEKLKSIPELSETAVGGIRSSLSPTAKGILDEAKAMQIHAFPEPVMTAGGRAKARMTLNEAVSFSNMSQDEIISLIESGKVFPYTSPSSAAKGTMMTRNIAEDLYGPYGAFVSPEQRPTQPIRQEWSVTQPAKDLAVNKGFKGEFGKNVPRLQRFVEGPEYSKFMYGKYAPTSSQAYSSPQLLTFYAKTEGDMFANPALNTFMALEEGVVSRDVKDMLRYEKITPKLIDISPGTMEVNQDIFNLIKKDPTIGKVITPEKPIGMGSEFLGIEKTTGRQLYTNKDMTKQSVTGVELIDPTTARVYLREEVGLEEGRSMKIFSEEAKHVMALEKGQQLRTMLGHAQVPRQYGQDIEAMIGSKIVERNKMALLNQQTEALGYFTSKMIEGNKLTARQRVEARRFLEDPTGYLNVGKKIDKQNIAQSFLNVEKELVDYAKWMGFGKEEMQLTFGLMDQGVAKTLGIAETIASSPGVIGATKMNLGGLLSGGGAGGLATIEQSALRLTTMKGSEGVMLAEDIMSRMMDKQGVTESDLMASSVLGQAERQKGTLEKLGSLSDESLIKAKGRYVDIGRKVKEFGGSSQLFIPGSEMSPSLMNQFRSSSTGELMDTDLVSSLRRFQEAVSTDDVEKIEARAKELREMSFLSSEREAAARGKVLGSRYLGATRREAAGDITRISEKEASDMFNEMIERTTNEQKIEYLKAEKERIIQKGEEGVAAIWRSPATGPESLQYTKFRVDKDLQPGTISVPARTGTLAIKNGQKTVEEITDISKAVGQKLDFDDDKINISMISDKGTAERIKKKIESDLDVQYNKYVFKHNVLKKEIASKRVQEQTKGLSQKTMLVAGHKKNTLAQTTTGRINLALQKIKMGLQATKPDEYRPLAEVLFHLEEASIGGKHGELGEKIYEGIVGSVETGGEKGKKMMTDVMESLFGPQRTVSGFIEAEGKKVPMTFDIAPKQWAETAISASDMVREETSAAVASARIAKDATKVKEMPIQEMQKIHNLRRQAQVDAAQRLIQEKADNVIKDRGTRAMQQMKRGKNVIGQIMSANKKTVGLGLAAAAAVMLFAPSMSGSISPEGPQGGAGFTPDMMGHASIQQMPIHQAGLGESPKIYDNPGLGQSKRANIRMTMRDYDDSQGDFQEDARSLSQYGNVRIRTTDDRSILDSFTLARKIDERL